MPDAFCTEDDVRDAMQERDSSGSLGDQYVTPTIYAVSRWLRSATGAYFYDSGSNIAGNNDIPTTQRSASTDHLDVPSSPHQQEAQLMASTYDRHHVRYPVTHAGRYAKIRLPHRFVNNITKLEVRDIRGGVTDWVADSEFSEGKDSDYYVVAQGVDSRGASHLFINANSLGARENFENLISVTYDYGLDYNDEPWNDIQRATALLAGAQLTADDNVLAQIPDQGQLVGVETQRQAHLSDAVGEAWSLLSPWLQREVA